MFQLTDMRLFVFVNHCGVEVVSQNWRVFYKVSGV